MSTVLRVDLGENKEKCFLKFLNSHARIYDITGHPGETVLWAIQRVSKAWMIEGGSKKHTKAFL